MYRAVAQGKHVVAVVHRRFGKDIFCVEAWLLRALTRVGTHIYLFPFVKQAREVIWCGMDFDGKPFLSAIPEQLIRKKNDQRMEITLINGSRMILGGSNNFNGLMGSNPVTIIYSEYALHNPLARQYMNPILVQNRGLEIIQSTPRGKNHLYDVFDVVRDSPNYVTKHLGYKQTKKHDGSPVIPEEYIKEAMQNGMSVEMIEQEFNVSFEVGNIGSYFTREMHQMEIEGRINKDIYPDPRAKLYSVWDLGGTDYTAGILFQLSGDYINIVHVIHDNNLGFKHYLDLAEEYRRMHNLQWGNHFAPHDIDQAHQGFEHAESRLIQARQYGWHFLVTPKINFEDGIEQVRFIFPKVRINSESAAILVRALREYQRIFDHVKGAYKPKPLENWAVHLADAFRYLCVNYKRLFSIPMQQRTYTYRD